jgi:hypothetical protein
MSDTQPNPAEPPTSAPTAEAAPPKTQSSTIPEPTPMLDVHPAHHAATTWREFFIHIATIVLGLIIAVGLEQAVEYLHHHHQARETRKNIQNEIAENLDILDYNQKQLSDTQQELNHNLDLLDSSAPDSQILPQLGTAWTLDRRHDAAWNAAKIDGSLALIPPSQIVHATYFYEGNDALSPTRFQYFTCMDTIGAIVEHGRAAGKLGTYERQQLISLTASALGQSRLLFSMHISEIRALQSNELQ